MCTSLLAPLMYAGHAVKRARAEHVCPHVRTDVDDAQLDRAELLRCARGPQRAVVVLTSRHRAWQVRERYDRGLR